MKLEHKIITSRPDDTVPNSQFTNAVIQGIKKRQKPPRNRLLSLLYASPAFAALAGIMTLFVLAGTAYAISYAWPLLNLQVSKPTTTSSGRQAVEVFGNACPDISNKKYELKKVSPFGIEKVPDIIKAECNLNAISRWADTTYPKYTLRADHESWNPDMTPGAIVTTKMLNTPLAQKIISIDATKITIGDVDESKPSLNLAITPSTKFIVDHQYKQAHDLKKGDAVAYISLITSAVRNNDDCTPESCGNTPISQSEELLAIVKLDMPYEDYGKFGSLSELMRCSVNKDDYCHTGNASSFELYTNYNLGHATDASLQYAQIEGSIQSSSPTRLVIKTSSGRIVTVNTTSDLVASFNANRGPYYADVKIGDTIQITYFQRGLSVRTDIDEKTIMNINVLVEINSKADLDKGTPPKF